MLVAVVNRRLGLGAYHEIGALDGTAAIDAFAARIDALTGLATHRA